MKKYITPNSECIQVIGAMLMETPSDNLGKNMIEKGMGNPQQGDKTF